jgi:hypothetical protein
MQRVVTFPKRDRTRAGASGRLATSRWSFSRRGVVLCLLLIFVTSIALRIALVTRVQAPTVFSDELGYNKLAQSIGQSGKLALFNNEGLSYSPLYPAVLSPIYAFGATLADAYGWIKLVNAFLISLSILPIYKIARFVLPRRESLLAAALSIFAPLMSFAAFTVSENLAYPVCLVAIWMMLRAIREPKAANDALLLVAVVAASAARVQLVVLVPAALTAAVLAGLFERGADESAIHSIARRVRRQWLLFGSVAAGLVLAGLGAVAGTGISSAFGRYAVVGQAGHPSVWELVELTVRHLAGIDLAVGVVPFVGAIVAAFAFFRSRTRAKALPFAAVAISCTVWLLVEVAWDAAQFDSPSGDLPRIHERFLIYVVPFFLIALLATVRLAATISQRVYQLAAGSAVLLLLVIPFHTVINSTVSFDSMGLEPFARVVLGQTVPAKHATLMAVWIALTLGLLYVVVRERLRSVVILVLIAFFLIDGVSWSRIESGGRFARLFLPSHRDWIDRAKPGGGVVLVTAADYPASALETAYSNESIARLYYICTPTFGPDFGEEQVTIDGAGRLRDSVGVIKARYAVMPAGLVVSGRIVTSNPQGRLVLVAAENGVLTLPPGTPPVQCHRPRV